MAGALQSLISDLVSRRGQPLGQVLHIGAGAGADLPLYHGAGGVTLVEGDEDAADRLGRLAAADDSGKVRVVAAVVSGDSRKRPFRRMNFPDLSALRTPSPVLKELFPGLKILSQDMVRPMDPAKIVGPLELSDSETNLLVIEAPGEALGILRALAAADLLAGFDAVHLAEALEPQYNKAPPAAEILAYLRAAGFAAAFEPHPEDPERPFISATIDRAAQAHKARIDTQARELKQAEARNARLARALEEARQQSRAQARASETAAEAAAREMQALRDALASARQQAEAAAALGKELSAAQEGMRAAETALKAMQEGQDGLRQELAQAQAELAEVQRESALRADQVAGLRAAREEMGLEMEALQAEVGQVTRDAAARAEAQAAELNARIQELGAARDEATRQAEALRAELAGVTQELAARTEQVGGLRDARDEVAVQMQALRADLATAREQVARIDGLETALSAARQAGDKAEEARRTAEHRLGQAREEMLKADGQIGLIRDLLLHGPGL